MKFVFRRTRLSAVGTSDRGRGVKPGTIGSVDEFAVVDGWRLRYRVAGEGPPAVFGHGLLGTLDQFEAETGALGRVRERVRLLMYDARGHGGSEGPGVPGAYTWQSLGEDMAALAAIAGEGPTVAGGASMGAATALWVALERPELVRALVLVMPPPLGGPAYQPPEERKALQLLEVLGTTVAAVGVEKAAELAAHFPGVTATPDDVARFGQWLRGQNPLALAHAIRGLVASPFHDPEAYRRIAVPTLVLGVEGDALHPARAAHLLGTNVPGARVRIAPTPMYWREHPDDFAAEVVAFLDAVG